MAAQSGSCGSQPQQKTLKGRHGSQKGIVSSGSINAAGSSSANNVARPAGAINGAVPLGPSGAINGTLSTGTSGANNVARPAGAINGAVPLGPSGAINGTLSTGTSGANNVARPAGAINGAVPLGPSGAINGTLSTGTSGANNVARPAGAINGAVPLGPSGAINGTSSTGTSGDNNVARPMGAKNGALPTGPDGATKVATATGPRASAKGFNVTPQDARPLGPSTACAADGMSVKKTEGSPGLQSATASNVAGYKEAYARTHGNGVATCSTALGTSQTTPPTSIGELLQSNLRSRSKVPTDPSVDRTPQPPNPAVKSIPIPEASGSVDTRVNRKVDTGENRIPCQDRAGHGQKTAAVKQAPREDAPLADRTGDGQMITVAPQAHKEDRARKVNGTVKSIPIPEASGTERQIEEPLMSPSSQAELAAMQAEVEALWGNEKLLTEWYLR
ncbi:collagen alpha-2(I) chain-like [Paramacrobiotus metropolitanus]|uniref:collagen alpha-2(I) chain-like n=1 Tax=Paramacrobiotus metropolitanus TaxID=2943436 RepID=UPI002445D9C8|nr:collagen alpha-2(I) chain-like [Paramacrobiotus metropolitanus]